MKWFKVGPNSWINFDLITSITRDSKPGMPAKLRLWDTTSEQAFVYEDKQAIESIIEFIER